MPNIQLNNLWIDNVSRSKAMKETVELNVSFDTTFEDIELLRLEMEKFVQAPENARDFQPDFNISVGGVGDLDKMVLYITIKHKSNWHNDGVRAVRRSKFMCALTMALKKIPIYGPGGGTEDLGGPANPTYSVAVSDQFAAAAGDAAAKKDEARMVPAHTDQTEEEARASEQHAASELNTRHLVVETEGLWNPSDDSVRSPTPSGLGDDPRRSRDIESVRNELLKRASTRGRRRDGEGLLSLTPTESGSAGHSVGGRLEPFDEEAQTGAPSAYRGGQAVLAVPEEERMGLYPSASQRSRHDRHQDPSMSHRDPRGPKPGHH